ncbi:MAG: esterase, partial [Anaerolineae bacterium]
MNREYHAWHSPTLNRKMELLVFGHAGAKVLIFPTSQGKFYEWEDRGMMWALGEHLERGWLQCY